MEGFRVERRERFVVGSFGGCVVACWVWGVVGDRVEDCGKVGGVWIGFWR